MKLEGCILFYWIHKNFPYSFHKNVDEKSPLCVGRPIFPGSIHQMREHIVIVEENKRIPPDRGFLPVFVEISPKKEIYYPGEYIQVQAASVGEVFNVIQSIFDRFQDWDTAATHAVNSSFSFDMIIRSCDTLLDVPLALSDNQFRYVSYSQKLAHDSGYESKYVEEGNYLPMEYINLLTAMPDYRQTEKCREVYQYTAVENMLHKNIFYKGVFVGRLSLPEDSENYVNRYRTALLCLVGTQVEQLFKTVGSFWHRRSIVTKLGNLLQDMLDGKQVAMALLYRLLFAQGWKSGDQFQLIQMKSHFAANESKLTGALSSQLEKLWPGSCCVSYQNRMVVFINISVFTRSTQKSIAQELAFFLRESLLLAGMSRRFTKIEEIQAALLQTDIALEIGQHIHPMYWYFQFDDYAYWDLLHNGCRSFTPEQICSPVILELQNYDKKNNTELNRSLRTFIEKRYNAVATSEALCIARSSFLKRLARIRELTKLDLEDMEQRIYLAMSYSLFDHYYQ